MTTVIGEKLAKFFDGDMPWFDGVSERMAYALPLGHPMGLRHCSGQASNRPEDSGLTLLDFWANERAIKFLGYDGDPANAKTFVADDCILLGQYPACATTGCITVIRTADGEATEWLDAATLEVAEFPDGDATVHKNTQPCFVPVDGVTGEFPAFDLYATRIDKGGITADPLSFPTVQLAAAADMADPKQAFAPAAWLAMQQTAGCSEWLIWAKLAADVPANSGLQIEMNHIIAAA